LRERSEKAAVWRPGLEHEVPRIILGFAVPLEIAALKRLLL
jgi:hypothetical protein